MEEFIEGLQFEKVRPWKRAWQQAAKRGTRAVYSSLQAQGKKLPFLKIIPSLCGFLSFIFLEYHLHASFFDI